MKSYRQAYPQMFSQVDRISGHAVCTYAETFTAERSDYNLLIRTPHSADTIGLYDFGKFLDCFPVAQPQGPEDIRRIWEMPDRCGILLPSQLMPVYQEQVIARMYGIANRLAALFDREGDRA